MITNLWQSVEIYCDNHEEPIKMTIQQGPHSLFYSCPKYYPENRNEDERACSNRINLIDYEAMINYIGNLLMDAELNNRSDNLANIKWQSKGIEYYITKHTKGLIKVKMINKKAIKGLL